MIFDGSLQSIKSLVEGLYHVDTIFKCTKLWVGNLNACNASLLLAFNPKSSTPPLRLGVAGPISSMGPMSLMWIDALLACAV